MSLLGKIAPAIQAAGKVIEDPYLPEISCHLLRLNKITRGVPAGPPCPRTAVSPTARPKGIGLSTAAKPLRAWVWAKENPIIAAAAGASIVGLIWGVGYRMGKKRKRR
jgi:hypothetical protein